MHTTALAAGVVAMLCSGSAAIFDKFGTRDVANPGVALIARMGTATIMVVIYAAVTGAFRDPRKRASRQPGRYAPRFPKVGGHILVLAGLMLLARVHGK